MDALETLAENVQRLLDENKQLKQVNADLQATNDRQREEMMRTHAELVQLQAEHKNLRMARGLADTPDERITAKRHLDAIIAQVDRAIEILKQ